MSKSSSNQHSKHFNKERDLKLARHFLDFNDNARSPFHAVAGLSTMLAEEGFEKLKESDDWCGRVKPGGRYFLTRHQSSLIAFTVGPGCNDVKLRNANGGDKSLPNGSQYPTFSIIAAHTDSPCFKVKPLSAVASHGYLQLGVECYGGGLWHTWFDRDLTVAGRVMVRVGGNGVSSRLVTVDKPILQIPNLAIHLSRNVNTDGFKVNKETDTVPILATQLAATLNAPVKGESSKDDDTDKRHPPLLLKCLAQELNVSPQDIVDVDLCVADTQRGAIGGVLDEFVMAPRLDNLASCFCAVNSLIGCTKSPASGKEDSVIRLVACFDHEEVGSRSVTGADSSLLPSILMRISKTLSFDYDRAMARGLLVSADMAHAVHPNYAAKHEGRHRPALGGGIVIKTNQNQRYATSGLSGFVVREVARLAGGVPVQEFVVPNDKPCGSTVGPFLASHTGIMTVDVGQPQLAMHSIREICSVHDFYLVIQVLKGLLEKHTTILENVDRASPDLF